MSYIRTSLFTLLQMMEIVYLDHGILVIKLMAHTQNKEGAVKLGDIYKIAEKKIREGEKREEILRGCKALKIICKEQRLKWCIVSTITKCVNFEYLELGSCGVFQNYNEAAQLSSLNVILFENISLKWQISKNEVLGGGP